tara:strand:- start:10647 stop:12455 length:1809 start_codon:yes stop_codon:yes gene_type:complete
MRIVRNENGAVMVMAVFMAMIVIGALYYLSGLGAAIVAQERMQDAADATAFSSAVIHARGMNLLALINIILASLLAILVMLSMLASMLGLAAKILFAVAFLVPPAATPAAKSEVESNAVGKIEKALRKPVGGAMKAMSGVQKILKPAIPLLANVNALKLSSENYQPVVKAGITFPIFTGLPAVDGDRRKLCLKAGEYAAELVMTPLEAVLGTGKIVSYAMDPLKEMARTAGEAYALYYCGEGPKPKPPSHTMDVPIPVLQTAAQVGCEKYKREADCKKYTEELQEVKDAYNATTGTCDSGNTTIDELCKVQRRKARSECDPRRNHLMTHVSYRRANVTRYYHLEGKRVVEDRAKRTQEGGRVLKEETPGGGRLGFPILCQMPGFDVGLTRDYTKWDFDADEPLCHKNFDKPELKDFEETNETTLSRTHVEFTDVLGCLEERTFTSEVGNAQATPEMKKSKPQEMCNCARQGESMFQIRSLVTGDADSLTGDASKRIVLATGADPIEESLLEGVGGLLGKFAMAQAEFYFDSADAEPAEWLWTMNWKARMRRLSFNRKKWQCPVVSNCGEETKDGKARLAKEESENSSVAEMVKGEFDSLIVH